MNLTQSYHASRSATRLFLNLPFIYCTCMAAAGKRVCQQAVRSTSAFMLLSITTPQRLHSKPRGETSCKKLQPYFYTRTVQDSREQRVTRSRSRQRHRDPPTPPQRHPRPCALPVCRDTAVCSPPASGWMRRWYQVPASRPCREQP